MNPTTILEQQYPLSPKKFWKKFLPGAVGLSIFGLFVSGMLLTLSIEFFSFPQSASAFVAIEILIFLLIVLTFSWYIKTYIKRYYYSTNTDFITIKKGVFAPREINVQYQKIQDVYVDQDLFDRILGLYDVHIASATVGSAMEAHIDGVDANNAEGLKNLFLNSIRGKNSAVSGSNFQPVITPQTEPIKVNLSENFSSETYPIASRWVYISVLRGIFHSLLFFLIVLFVPGRNSQQNLIGLLGYDSYTLWVIILGCLAIVIFQVWYAIIWKRNYRFEFTPEYIFTHESVISTKEVIVSQGIIERLVGLYNVTIQNAVSSIATSNNRQGSNGIKIPGQSLEKATKISNFLKSVLVSKNTGQSGL